MANLISPKPIEDELKAIAEDVAWIIALLNEERAGLIIDTANDELRRDLQSIKLQQKRGPDLDEWGNRR